VGWTLDAFLDVGSLCIAARPQFVRRSDELYQNRRVYKFREHSSREAQARWDILVLDTMCLVRALYYQNLGRSHESDKYS
jgi:hypothetical protein